VWQVVGGTWSQGNLVGNMQGAIVPFPSLHDPVDGGPCNHAAHIRYIEILHRGSA